MDTRRIARVDCGGAKHWNAACDGHFRMSVWPGLCCYCGDLLHGCTMIKPVHSNVFGELDSDSSITHTLVQEQSNGVGVTMATFVLGDSIGLPTQ